MSSSTNQTPSEDTRGPSPQPTAGASTGIPQCGYGPATRPSTGIPRCGFGPTTGAPTGILRCGFGPTTGASTGIIRCGFGPTTGASTDIPQCGYVAGPGVSTEEPTQAPAEGQTELLDDAHLPEQDEASEAQAATLDEVPDLVETVGILRDGFHRLRLLALMKVGAENGQFWSRFDKAYDLSISLTAIAKDLQEKVNRYNAGETTESEAELLSRLRRVKAVTVKMEAEFQLLASLV
ncbi:hypothetical protein F5B20DRAFT_583284 [Whalleya microplaca]|nr:hypothetical protein F5B20DRAFT_583284 [Whalleya microplaca]